MEEVLKLTGKEYIEKTFSLEKFIENYENLYKSILGDIK